MMDEDDDTCIFKPIYGAQCNPKDRCSSNVGPSRIHAIIAASKIYADGIWTQLETNLSSNPELIIHYHKNCVSKYTSKTNISRKKSQFSKRDEGPSHKKLRHSIKQFDFKLNCLYCGEPCDITKNIKNPSRWHPAYMCRSTYSEYEGKPYTAFLLDRCKARGDTWASDVQTRILGAVSDLHAAEARYHKDCMTRFMGNRGPPGETCTKTSSCSDGPDDAFHDLVNVMSSNKSRIWNTIELHDEYSKHPSHTLSRRTLVERLQEHFGEDLLILTSPGIAGIVIFKSSTSHTLKLVKDDDGDAVTKSVKVLGKVIVKECKAIAHDKDSYKLHMDRSTASESVSETLGDLLSLISPNLDRTLPGLLIGNMITSVVTNKPTDLQIALGILMRDSKELLTHMHDYRVTCSYDEVLRFKKSAAAASANDLTQQGLCDAKSGLVQVVCDNFDTDISSPNGKTSTHSLAMIIMQPTNTDHPHQYETIRRLRKNEVSLPIQDKNEEIRVYEGPKKPTMPCIPLETIQGDFKRCQDISNQRASHNDFVFISDILTCERCPEYNGYNTNLCREQGHSMKPKTKIVYMPLLDMPPADYTTMLSAMLRAQKISKEIDQNYVVFTCDQQLYKVALHIKWNNMDEMDNVYLRLGGMHLLMSYIGCIGTLMTETGIVDVLSSAFGGVLKMLLGKKFPQNVRALRLLVEELLRPVLSGHNISSMDGLLRELENIATRSRTASIWVNCLIRPVFIVMKYIRAERESDWALHLAAVEEMIALFFAAGHVNYARYALYYLRSMQNLPPEIRAQFIQGQHTMHHNSGIFNGIWSDMAIETTFMRYGHSRSGIVGITLKPETLKTWAWSLHTCHTLLKDMNEMRDEETTIHQTTHKEEQPGRIKLDGQDRKSLQDKLELCINPLDPNQHPADGLVNIGSGEVVTQTSINVDQAVKLGKEQMEKFEQSWPEGFFNPIPKIVRTMAVSRKHIKIGNSQLFDTETLYARAMGLRASDRDIDTNTLLSHELSPVPTSLFDKSGSMRIAKTKSVLKNSLKVESSSRLADKDIQAIFLDGCAVLWVIPWPCSGTVLDYLTRFRSYIQNKLTSSNVFLIFDKYLEGSIKETTRHTRNKSASRKYTLRHSTQLPSQKVILTVPSNKVQLINLIVEDLIAHKDEFQVNQLLITGSDPVPVQISNGTIVKRYDMTTTQEEADTIIIQQVSQVAAGTVHVVADDTDIFLLLMHYCHKGDISCKVLMVSPIQGRAVLDINSTVDKHQAIVKYLLAMHALTGCDTVASYFGIGKGVGLKILKTGRYKLDLLGMVDEDLQFSEVMKQSSEFLLACYGQAKAVSFTEARQKVWAAKVAKGKACAPKLCTLPPTCEAASENIARAHLQLAVWYHALERDPPTIEPTSHGWSKLENSNSLCPKTVPSSTSLAPDQLLKLIRCSCQSDLPCKSQNCSCTRSNMACTLFCECQGGRPCQNEKNVYDDDEEEDDGVDNGDDDDECF